MHLNYTLNPLKQMARIFAFLSFALLVAGSSSAQILISGQVSDESTGNSLPGVNVIVKEKASGTTTDMDGKFSLTIDNAATLCFSMVGFKTQEIAVESTATLNVALAPDLMNLDEFVVVGYGSVKKSHLSGSIAKVNNETLDKIPVSRSDKALQGLLAGVQIQQTDAQAGAAPKITIRGVSSINTDNSPLIVVDGFPIPNDLSAVDMSNVESIEILKDAASAAIYGSRASNGVILITTKKGTAGKTSFNYSTYLGVKNPYSYDHIYPTTQEWADFANNDAASSGIVVPDQIQAMLDLGTYTDWEDVALRENAFTQNHSFSASGGTNKYQFYIGGGYTQDEGIVETNDYEKYNISSTIDANITDWLQMGASFTGSYSEQRKAAIGFHDIIRTQAWCPVYHTEETLPYAIAAGYDVEVGDLAHERHFEDVNGVNLTVSTGNNGWAYLEGQDRTYKRLSANANTYAKIDLGKNLFFKSTFGTYFKNVGNYYYMASYAKNKGDTKGSLGDYQTMNWLNENTLNYNKAFGNHEFGALAGFSMQNNSYQTSYIEVSDFLTDEIHTLNAGTVINDAYTQVSRNTLVSSFFRLNYAYANKYIAAISSRLDGSSRFGANNKWGYFPAASIAWRVSEESFLENADWISEMKIRASYGSTGNNNIGDYSSLAVVSPGANMYFADAYQGFVQTNIANPYLSWEKTSEFDLGLDFGVLDGRVALGVDYYNIRTDQLLLNREVPSITGFTNSWTNMGLVENKGIEFEIKSYNVRVDDVFSWSTSANFYMNDNKLIDFGGTEELISTPDSKRPSQYIAREGEPLVQFYGYEVDHSMGDNGEVVRSQMENPYYPIAVESAYVYVKDQNGDGVITEDDRVVLGSPYSDFDWSIINNFTFKDFDLSFMVQGSHGAQIYNVDSYYYGTQWKGGYVEDVDNEDMLVSKIISDWNVQDASYVTLRNLMFGYTLPKHLTNKWNIDKARVYFTGYNLLYFMSDDYTGLNPEGVNRYDETLTWGYQRGSLPVERSYCVGLELKF